MHPLVATAIADLYASSQARVPLAVEGCPCCTSPEQLAALIAVPLRELTPAQLGFYGRQALTTVGSIDDFRYFWPRLAELAVTESSDWFVDHEILFGKVAAANWRTWPAAEQRATESFAAAVILRMRDHALSRADVDQWVCAVGQLFEDVTPLLDAALLDSSPAARQNLYGFYDWNRRDIEKRGGLGNAFWRSAANRHNVASANVVKIVAWLHRADVATAVDQAYADVFSRGEPTA
jgi:hypothetical protein